MSVQCILTYNSNSKHSNNECNETAQTQDILRTSVKQKQKQLHHNDVIKYHHTISI